MEQQRVQIDDLNLIISKKTNYIDAIKSINK